LGYVETGRPMQRAKKALACIAAGAAMTMAAGGAAAQDSTSQPSVGSQTTAPLAATNKLSAAPPVTYDNRYEIYGGINLMNFQAGQNLPKRMNLGGVELLGTYWLTTKVGLGGEFRGEAGTTPMFPQGLATNHTDRPLVVLYSGLFGAQYRGPKNQRAALNFHAYGGVAHGSFDESNLNNFSTTGLYTDRNAPLVALGASVDFNRSKNLAIRLSPDLMLEHFGTETREFFAISGGVVYRFGHR
jgi:hypothetical protein